MFGMTKPLTEEHVELCRMSSIVKCSTCWKMNLIFKCHKLVKEGVYQWATDSELPQEVWEYILAAGVWDGIRWCDYNWIDLKMLH